MTENNIPTQESKPLLTRVQQGLSSILIRLYQPNISFTFGGLAVGEAIWGLYQDMHRMNGTLELHIATAAAALFVVAGLGVHLQNTPDTQIK